MGYLQASVFQRTLKIIIAELLTVMTILPGWSRQNNSDNAEKCSFTIVRPQECKAWFISRATCRTKPNIVKKAEK